MISEFTDMSTSQATRATENQDYYMRIVVRSLSAPQQLPSPLPPHGGNEKGKAKYDYNPRCPHENANNYR